MARTIAGFALALGIAVMGSDAALAAAPAVHDVAGTSQLTAVACETSSACVAVGAGSPNVDYGAVVSITKGVAGTAKEVTTTGTLVGDACWSSKQCLAIGTALSGLDAVVLPISSGAPGTAITLAGASTLYGIACLPHPSTTCYAVGQDPTQSVGLLVPIVNGVVGKSTSVPGMTQLDAIACPAPSTCFASGQATSGDGAVLTIASGAPGAESTTSLAGELFGIACTSDSLCYAVGTSEIVTVSAGTVGTAHAWSHGLLYSIMCVAGGKCLASGYIPHPREGVETTVNGGVPGAAVKVVGTEDLFSGSCATAKACEVAGETSDYTVGLFAKSAA